MTMGVNISWGYAGVIDLGPEGGEGGGTIVAQGTVEELSKNKTSITGKFLKKVIK